MAEKMNHESRIVKLEESAMHMERTIDALNDQVRALQEMCNEQNRTLSQLADAIAELTEGEVEDRVLEDEKPPHY